LKNKCLFLKKKKKKKCQQGETADESEWRRGGGGGGGSMIKFDVRQRKKSEWKSLGPGEIFLLRFLPNGGARAILRTA